YWWDADELTQFAAPGKLSEVLLLLGTGISIVLLPAIAAVHPRGDDVSARRLVREAERWTSLLLWPVVAVAFAMPGAIIHVGLSDQAARAIVPLQLLFVQALVASLVVPLQTYAIATGHP